MAIIDVLKCDRPEKMVWKWQPPEGGLRQEELRLGTQLVVNHSQQAVFVKGGEIADIFEAGTHTLSTENLPILSGLIGLAFGGQSPFKAEVYFFNKAIAMDTKFALRPPFNMIEPNFRVTIPIVSRGSFAVKITDVRLFISQIIGTLPDFEAATLSQYFRGIITEQIKAAIIRISREQNLSPLELEAIVIDVSDAVKGIFAETLARYGLFLELFSIEAISIVDDDPRVKKVIEDYQSLMAKDMEERMRLRRHSENLEVYKVERSFDTTEAAAGNIGGGSDGGAGSILGTMLGYQMVQPLGSAIGTMVGTITPNVQQTVTDEFDEIDRKMKKLGEWKAEGILTDEVYNEKIKELLNRI